MTELPLQVFLLDQARPSREWSYLLGPHQICFWSRPNNAPVRADNSACPDRSVVVIHRSFITNECFSGDLKKTIACLSSAALSRPDMKFIVISGDDQQIGMVESNLYFRTTPVLDGDVSDASFRASFQAFLRASEKEASAFPLLEPGDVPDALLAVYVAVMSIEEEMGGQLAATLVPEIWSQAKADYCRLEARVLRRVTSQTSVKHPTSLRGVAWPNDLTDESGRPSPSFIEATESVLMDAVS